MKFYVKFVSIIWTRPLPTAEWAVRVARPTAERRRERTKPTEAPAQHLRPLLIILWPVYTKNTLYTFFNYLIYIQQKELGTCDQNLPSCYSQQNSCFSFNQIIMYP